MLSASSNSDKGGNMIQIITSIILTAGLILSILGFLACVAIRIMEWYEEEE